MQGAEVCHHRFTINFSLVVIYPSMVEFTINGVWAVVAIFRLY